MLKKMLQFSLAIVAVMAMFTFAKSNDCKLDYPLELIDAEGVSTYKIRTCGELYGFADMVKRFGDGYRYNVVLGADIVVNKDLFKNGVLDEENIQNFIQWTPIGVHESGFWGTFDGDGHSISGLYFDDANADYVGLFGYLAYGTVRNVRVINSYIKGKNYVGGVVGYNEEGFVSSVSYDGFVDGKNSVGGVVGKNSGGPLGPNIDGEKGKISEAFNRGSVSGVEYVGGVVGYNSSGVVTDVYNMGSVGASTSKSACFFGGVVGYSNNGIVQNVYSTGTVNYSGDFVGSVAGSISGGFIDYCYYDVDFYAGNALGKSEYSDNYDGAQIGENIAGKTTPELVSMRLSDAFSSDVWERGSVSVESDGSVTFNLPYVKDQKPNLATIKFEADDDKFLKISNILELNWFVELVNSGYTTLNAKLTTDICLNACGENDEPLLKQIAALGVMGDFSKFSPWTPIGKLKSSYEGVFDGGYHVIRGLYFNNDQRTYGSIFSVVGEKGVVRNLGVEDSYIVGGDYVGGVVGLNSGSVSSVYFTGSVIGVRYGAGGVVGKNDGSVSDVFTFGSVNGSEIVGGVVGENNGNVCDVFSMSSVTRSMNSTAESFGAVVGVDNSGFVSNSYFDTEYFSGNALGVGMPLKQVAGMNALDLASLDVRSAFTSGAWLAGSTNPTVVNDNEFLFSLPRLNHFTLRPEGIYIGFRAKDDVYEIGDATELKLFAVLVNSGKSDIQGKLTADICLNACGENDKPLLEQIADLKSETDISTLGFEQWTPIGDGSGKEYKGVFDGDGHTVRGLYIDNSTKVEAGLFGAIIGKSSVAMNFGVVDSYIKGDHDVGSVAGLVHYGATVSNVFNAATVKGNHEVGGVVGVNFGKVKDVYNTGLVIGEYDVGGIVGENVSFADANGSIESVYNTGFVVGQEKVGGVVGRNTVDVSNSYFNKDFFFGEAIGENSSLSVDASTVAGKMTVELATETLPAGFGAEWISGARVRGDDAEVFKLPYISLLGERSQPKYTLPIEIGEDEKSYYQIGGAKELTLFSALVNNGEYGINGKLTADIVYNKNVLNSDGSLSEDSATFIQWNPIGNFRSINSYEGVFDGANHTISGLYFNGSGVAGLFGAVNAGVVKNVGVIDSYFKGGHYTGGVVAYMKGSTKLSNVYNMGSVASTSTGSGGVVGLCKSGEIRNAYHIGPVSGSGSVGGVIGWFFGGTAENVYSVGSVVGKDEFGGAVGLVDDEVISFSNGYFDADFFGGNAYGSSKKELADENVAAVTTANLANGKLPNGFDEDFWNAGSHADGSLVYNLPYLKSFAQKDHPSISTKIVVTPKSKYYYPSEGFTKADVESVKLYLGDAPVEGNWDVNDLVFDPVDLMASLTVTGSFHGINFSIVLDKKDVFLPNILGDYTIQSVNDLYEFAKLVNLGYTKINGKVQANLVVNENVFEMDGSLSRNSLSFRKWIPIGTRENPYVGNFDGGGKTISGLYLNDVNKDMGGLFGYVGKGGNVHHVGVYDSYIKGRDYVGGVVGYNDGGSIQSVFSFGSVSGESNVGGLVGYNNAGFVKNSYCSASVRGTGEFVGGLVGYENGNVEKIFYNTDFFAGDALGNDSENKGLGLSTVELSTKGVGGEFLDESDWHLSSNEQPLLEKGKLFYELPGFEGFPEIVLLKQNADNVYEISSAQQLKWFANLANTRESGINGKLTANICMNACGKNNLQEQIEALGENGDISKLGFEEWTPIGTSAKPYKGIFDGNGHTISGLYFNDTHRDSVGLFGYEKSGTIKNLGLVDSYIRGRNSVGGITGSNDKGLIGNVFNAATVIGTQFVAGVAGANNHEIIQAYNTGKVNGEKNVYRVAGSGSIMSCYYNTDVPCVGCLTDESAKGMTTAELANGTLPNGFNDVDELGMLWVAGSSNEEDNGSVTFKLPYLQNSEATAPVVKFEADSDKHLKISNVRELNWFATLVNGGHKSVKGRLTADICLNACAENNLLEQIEALGENGDISKLGFEQWTPIGKDKVYFEGAFDGNGHTVSGLFFNNADMDSVGFFGITASKSNVKNLGVVDSYIKGHDCVGSVVGHAKGGVVNNVYSMASVNGNSGVGGVVGDALSSAISGAYSAGSISGKSSIGGVVGRNSGSSVYSVYSTSSVIGPEANNFENIGGLVGVNENGRISNSYYNTDIFAGNAVGNESGVRNNVKGLSTMDLALLDIQTAFTVGDWVPGSVKVLENDNKYLYMLPGLKNEKSRPEIVQTGLQPNGGVFEIGDAMQLKFFASLVNSGSTSINGRLTADICLNACGENDKPLLEQIDALGENGDISKLGFEQWTPIGTFENSYVGCFDGAGHTVRGLYFNDGSMDNVGLFGRIGDAEKTAGVVNAKTVENVGVIDSYIKGKNYVGGVVGYNNGGSVNNVYHMGFVTSASAFVGGVVGFNLGIVSDVFNIGDVKGLVGQSDYAFGGVLGYLDNDASVSNAYSIGFVRAGQKVGGVVGYYMDGKDLSISNCYFDLGLYTKGDDSDYASGLTMAQLASGTLPEGFSSGKWTAGSYEFSDDKVVFRLPFLSVFASDKQPKFTLAAEIGSDGKSYYKIDNAMDLNLYRSLVNDGYSEINGKLKSDIVLNKNVLVSDGSLNDSSSAFVQWIPMGTSALPFSGTFDGDGHSISGLYINDDAKDSVGLFGNVGAGGVVQKVGVENSYIVGKSAVGSIAGVNGGSISNVYNTGFVSGKSAVGGLSGRNDGSIGDAYENGRVVGTDSIGGIAGYSNGTIKSVYNIGAVEGFSFVGSLVGVIGENSKVDDSYNSLESCMALPFGNGSEDAEGAINKIALQLSNLVFNSEAWLGGSKGVVAENGKLVYKLPGLKVFNMRPEIPYFEIFEPVDYNGKKYYEISSVEQLKLFALLVNSGSTAINAKLLRDICLNACEENEKSLLEQIAEGNRDFDEWIPIGNDMYPFAGTFDGMDEFGEAHTIRGLYFNSENEKSVGLFGSVDENGTVMNVGVADSYILGGCSVGGIVGKNGGTVSSVYSTSSVGGKEKVGGIVGENNGNVNIAFNTGDVNGREGVGGIVGENNGSVKDTYNSGSVIGEDGVNGVIGRNMGRSKFCYYNKNVTCENCGFEDMSKTTKQLATLDVNNAFSNGDAWIVYADEQPVVSIKKLVYRLPGLKMFGKYPEIPYSGFKVNEDGVYEISTAEQLKLFAKLVNAGDTEINGKLMADICLNACGEDDMPLLEQIASLGEYEDISNLKFEPWTTIDKFGGNFDGAGHVIRGLYFNNEYSSSSGLFGSVKQNATVTNLGIVDSYIKGGMITGGVVGYLYGSISNVYNRGSVYGTMAVGGVVGGIDNGSVDNAYNLGSVESYGSYSYGTDFVGGIVGAVAGGSVSNAYNAGAVSGSYVANGAVGMVQEGSTISNIYNDKDMPCEKCKAVDGVSDVETAELANGTLPSGFDATAWGAGLHEKKSLVYNLPYLRALEAQAKPMIVNKPVVTVKNADVYFKSGDVTGSDFKVTLSFDDDQFEKDNSKFNFSKSTWGSDGIVKGTFCDVDFTITAPSVVIANDKAVVFGASKETVRIPEATSVSGPVEFKRSFAAVGSGLYSTVMFPFSAEVPEGAEASFLSFAGMVNDKGTWRVAVNKDKVTSLEANTPYLVQIEKGHSVSSITLKNVKFVEVDGGLNRKTMGKGSPWNLVGTYAYKTWKEDDSMLGKVYGFAGAAGNSAASIGKFKKVGAGAYVNPMRVYLRYYENELNVRALPNSSRVPQGTLASLPEDVDVVIVDANDSSKTTTIGTINTRTGNLKAKNNRYFDAKGRNVGKKPAAKGSYYR